MEVFRITGGRKLSGEIEVASAKNACLPILASVLLTEGMVTIESCPALRDVQVMLEILETLGCRVEVKNGRAVIDPSGAHSWEMPEHLSKMLRSSIFMLGPLLGRFRRAMVTYPGGCEIGLRPIDLHLKGLRSLGVKIHEAHGMIYCDGTAMRGGDVVLDFPSVGATENIMMAAVLSKGRTVIHNAAREPEIVDLQNFINAMGGRVAGAGSSVVMVEGVKELRGVVYRPMPDRIVAGTLLEAVAMTGGQVRLLGARAGDMQAVLDKLEQAGCCVEADEEGISLVSQGMLKAVDISTQPFPGFPTDMQAQTMAMCCVAQGTSVLVENVFENRFAHASEFRRMGADVLIRDRTAVVRGGRLMGARVYARDLRGGAALTLAGLAAEGVTEVANVSLIDRGYEALEKSLNALGADVKRL